jgi:uncharacterized protein (DUF1015 family)
MVNINAMSAYRLDPKDSQRVAALPYDVFTRQEAADEIAAHPDSFLRIDRTAALLPEMAEYDARVYEAAARMLKESIESGQYVLDEEARFYLYRMAWLKGSSEGESSGNSAGTKHADLPDKHPVDPATHHIQLGLVASVSIADYRDNTIRRHENTRPEKLTDRVNHIKALGAQASPVLMAHRVNQRISTLHDQVIDNSQQRADFTAPDGIRHTLWAIDTAMNPATTQAYAELETLYIADGHHRAEAAHVSNQSGIYAILFPADMLYIHAYNRVVKDLNGMNALDFLSKLEQFFTVDKITEGAPASAIEPMIRGQFAMSLEGEWYKLTLDEALRPAETLAALDVSVLQDKVLQPMLGIDDPRTSPRITYVGGSLGIAGLEHRMTTFAENPNEAIAFALMAVDLNDFFAVSDAGQLMPPKSTWFAPKPRSGLLILPS